MAARARLREVIRAYLAHLGPQYSIVYLPLVGTLRSASDYFVGKFPNSITYLGPLRDEPRSLQPLSGGGEHRSVGLRGEQSASVFNVNKLEMIEYIPSAAIVSSDEPAPVRTTLTRALHDWLHYMGLAESVEVEDQGRHGHGLRLTTEGVVTLHDLTHVGVGVSQVFPILLACLLADPDTTLIFEQPELHLHPRVQAQLGDFFLSMALSKKQCIIETHSEHLVNRLRYRAASMLGNTVVEASKIYFVEKQGGSSKFREVTFNEYGAVIDWPKGFFDQSQLEAENIIRSAIRKRSQKG